MANQSKIHFVKTESNACLSGYSWVHQVFFPKFLLSKLIALVTSENSKMVTKTGYFCGMTLPTKIFKYAYKCNFGSNYLQNMPSFVREM